MCALKLQCKPKLLAVEEAKAVVYLKSSSCRCIKVMTFQKNGSMYSCHKKQQTYSCVIVSRYTFPHGTQKASKVPRDLPKNKSSPAILGGKTGNLHRAFALFTAAAQTISNIQNTAFESNFGPVLVLWRLHRQCKWFALA